MGENVGFATLKLLWVFITDMPCLNLKAYIYLSNQKKFFLVGL